MPHRRKRPPGGSRGHPDDGKLNAILSALQRHLGPDAGNPAPPENRELGRLRFRRPSGCEVLLHELRAKHPHRMPRAPHSRPDAKHHPGLHDVQLSPHYPVRSTEMVLKLLEFDDMPLTFYTPQDPSGTGSCDVSTPIANCTLQCAGQQ